MPDLPKKYEKMGPGKNPIEQTSPDGSAPFTGGGRHADLPYDYQQREAADADYVNNLARVRRQDKEALGQMHGKIDGTPWVGRGRGRNAGG